jgi:diguanylate cyclase (GGDEF)-like protein/PAS domain S-box-containing protein
VQPVKANHVRETDAVRLNLTIAAKLAIAYALFLLPIAYLGYQMVSDKKTNIDFTRKEIIGLHYIAVVRSVQDALARGSVMTGLVEQIKANEKALGADLKTAAYTEVLLKALGGSDQDAAIQAAVDLIAKAADGSNLTLDPDLDSYYTQDALTVKVPAAVANAALLARAVASRAGHEPSVAEQVKIGVQTGGLQPTLDHLVSDIDSAARGNPDGTVGRTVTSLIVKVSEVAGRVMASIADDRPGADTRNIALPLLDTLTAAGTADAAEVEHLLKARISGFRTAEMTSGWIAIALFLTAVIYVLVVVQRGAIRPLRALTTTMSKLAGRDLGIEVGGLTRGDEVGGMARAVQVFKDNMIEAEALAIREASSIRASERRFRGLIQNTSDMILICAAPGTITYQSPAAGSTWGYPIAGLLGESLITLIHPEDQPALREIWELLQQSLPDSDEGTRTTELRLRDEAGNWRQAELVGTNLLHDSAIHGLVVTIRDITERKAFERQLTQQAFYDSLTRLPNRALFHDRFKQSLIRAGHHEEVVGLLFLDLDNFKLVNDSLGHQVGDQLLTEAAARLRSCVRSQDTVARLGGDEFVIILERLAGEADAILVAEAIAHQFSSPFVLQGREIVVTASVGIAVGDAAGTMPTTCCAMRTSRCTAPRAMAAPVTSCSTPACTLTPWPASNSSMTCAMPSHAASCAFTTSRS